MPPFQRHTTASNQLPIVILNDKYTMKNTISNPKRLPSRPALLVACLLLLTSLAFAGGGFLSVHIETPHLWIPSGNALLTQPPLGNAVIAPTNHYAYVPHEWNPNFNPTIYGPEYHIYTTYHETAAVTNPAHLLQNAILDHNPSSLEPGNAAPLLNPIAWGNMESDAENPQQFTNDLNASDFNPVRMDYTSIDVASIDLARPEAASPGLPAEAQALDETGYAKQSEAGAAIIARLKTWPNPSNGRFQAAMEGLPGESFTYRVLDAAGNIVLELKATHEATDFDLSHLAAGSYYLQAMSEAGKIYSSSLVFQH